MLSADFYDYMDHYVTMQNDVFENDNQAGYNMKKAQITIFLVIGLVLLIMFSIIYYAATKLDGLPLIGDKFSPVESYIQQCFGQVAEDGLNLAGLQGGHIYLESEYIITPYQKISYELPENDFIQQELDRFIEQGVSKCFNFTQFDQRGYAITVTGNATSTANIYDDTVVFSLDIPITITKSADTKTLNSFQYISKTRIGHALGIMRHLLSQNNSIDLTEAAGYDVNINLFPYNDVLVYNLEDPKSNIDGRFYNILSARRI